MCKTELKYCAQKGQGNVVRLWLQFIENLTLDSSKKNQHCHIKHCECVTSLRLIIKVYFWKFLSQYFVFFF